ncbi:MAG: hypothetical protein CMJ48_12285 [Planctomycetaceae bacterium]|nr:hypothetical protein [Planctomycetaceae bacterium]
MPRKASDFRESKKSPFETVGESKCFGRVLARRLRYGMAFELAGQRKIEHPPQHEGAQVLKMFNKGTLQ